MLAEGEPLCCGNAAAVSEIAQEQNVSVTQVNRCLNQVDLNGDGVVKVIEVVKAKKHFVVAKTASPAAVVQHKTATATATPTATPTATATAAATATALPPTGGPMSSAALALGAGALLVAGGLVARRIIR